MKSARQSITLSASFAALLMIAGCGDGENQTVEMDQKFMDYVEANPELQDVGAGNSTSKSKPAETGLSPSLQN